MLKRLLLLTALAGAGAGVLTPTAVAATAPNVSTGGATSVSPQSATLTGTVSPHGQPATYYFQYGTTTSYGAQTPSGTLTATPSAVSVSAPVSGLTPQKTYHFRVVAYSAAGRRPGGDRTFKTPALPVTASIVATPNPVLFGDSLVVTGALVNAAAGTSVVLQTNPFPFTNGFVDVGDPHVISSSGGFAFPIIALPLTTQFRVRSNTASPVYSPVVTEGVAVRVRARAVTHRAGRATVARFLGDVTPATDGARVEAQRLNGRRWVTYGSAAARGSRDDRSGFSVGFRFRRGGLFRVRVVAADGYHTTGYSGVVRLRAARR